MEDIPLHGRMEDNTFDHDESDYLLSPSDTSVSYRRKNQRKKDKKECGRYYNKQSHQITQN